MHFKTTDSPWACKKAGVCVTLIQAWTVGSPTSFEEVSLDSGPHGLRGTRQGLLTELWKPWCSCSPRGGLNTPGLEVDFFRTCVDTWNEMEDNAVAVRPTWGEDAALPAHLLWRQLRTSSLRTEGLDFAVLFELM